MPTYEYACKFCGHAFETFQPITADPLRRCPACHKRGLQRLISGGAGVIFKGSGFYETDYRRSAAKTEFAPDTSAKPASEKKPADPKPLPKPEPVKPPAAGKPAHSK